MSDVEDEYGGSDEFEAEAGDEGRDPAPAAALSDASDHEDGGDECAAARVAPTPAPPSPSESARTFQSNRQASARSPASSSYSSRHATPKAKKKALQSVLNQAPWSFTVQSKRIRGLRVPITTVTTTRMEEHAPTRQSFPLIRDIRVFAVLDKQPMQSRGSRWVRQDSAVPLPRSNAPRRASTIGRRVNGFLEAASWRHDDGEMQWTLTMDRFRRLKAYNPRIKVFVFGIGDNARADSVRVLSEDSPTRDRESIVSLGWFFLDMRTPDLPDRWFKIKNSPFGGEIMVSSSFTPADLGHPRSPGAAVMNPSKQMLPTQSAAADTPPRVKVDPLATGTGMPNNGISNCLRLGPSQGTDIFVVSVFIQKASKLLRAVHSAAASTDAERNALQTGFWLSYSLFDVVVQTDIFYNLERSEFPPIRDSFRVMSCIDDLRAFVIDQQALSVYLCTENNVLSSADIPLSSLLEQELFTSKRGNEINPADAVVEGTYPLGADDGDGTLTGSFSIGYENTNNPAVNEDEVEESSIRKFVDTEDLSVEEKPCIVTTDRLSVAMAVQVRLKLAAISRFAGLEGVIVEVLVSGEPHRHLIEFSMVTKEYVIGGCTLNSADVSAWETASISISCASSTSDILIASSEEETTKALQDGNELKFALRRDGKVAGDATISLISDAANSSGLRAGAVYSGRTRRYRVFLHAKSVRDFEVSRTLSLTISNPFVDKEQVEIPPIPVVKNAEVDYDDAHCIFEIHREESQFKKDMESSVVLDFAEPRPDGKRQEMGQALFNLNYLYFSEERFRCAHTDCNAIFESEDEVLKHCKNDHIEISTSDAVVPVVLSFKSCSIALPIVRNQTGSSTRVGSVRVVAFIEQSGQMSEADVATAQERHVPVQVGTAMGQSCLIRDMGLPKPSTDVARISPLDEVVHGSTRDGDAHPQSEPRVESDNIQKLKDPMIIENTAWKKDLSVQQAQWKKRFAEMEKARMDELEEEWARREEERSTILRSTQAEYQRLEQKLRSTLAEVETRERKLGIAEATFARDQRLLKEDHDLLRRRLQSEQSHSVSLAQHQVEVMEKRLTDLLLQLKSAEKRTQEVENDFAEYRRQQRKVPESKLREEISSLNGQIVILEREKLAEVRARDAAETKLTKMQLQLEKMAMLVQGEKKKHEARVVDELEKLRVKYIAREERYVLDGDRDELRAIKKQLDELRQVNLSGRQGTRSFDRGVRQDSPHDTDATKLGARLQRHSQMSTNRERRHSWGSSESSPKRRSLKSDNTKLQKWDRRQVQHGENLPRMQMRKQPHDHELDRLRRERDTLLKSGVYTADSFLVRELERLIVLREDSPVQKSQVM